MNVTVTAAVPGAPNLRIGDPVELPPDEARAWLASGVAVASPAGVKAEKPAPAPRIVEAPEQ